MRPGGNTIARADAVARAEAHSPFLREAMRARPDLLARFTAGGSKAALERALQSTDPDLATELRRQRLGLALAVALGDLSGELPLESVTAVLSDFAVRAIDRFGLIL